MGASFSTTWKDIYWSVNWSRNRNMWMSKGSKSERTEDSVSLWMSVPLGRWLGNSDNDIKTTALMQHSSGRDTRYEIGLNGQAFDRRLYWDVSEQITPGSSTGNNSSRLNLGWRGTYGEVTGMYSYSTHLRQDECWYVWRSNYT